MPAAGGHQDEEQRTPLMLAARDGKLKIVKLLISRGADVNARDNRGFVPLINAASKPEIGFS